MKAHWFVILVSLMLLSPRYTSAQEVPPSNITYEKVGDFVYVTAAYILKACEGACRRRFIELTPSCPADYAVISGGFDSEVHTGLGLERYAPSIYANEPTGDHTGWLLGFERVRYYPQHIKMTLVCTTPSR
jgi:hypothetical protein